MLLNCIILFCATVASSVAMYTDMDDVLELSPMNFKQNVLDNQKLVVVEFYASWCGHCQTFAPEWMEVAKKLKGIVTVGAIQCDKDINRSLCEKYNVRRYPTIKIFNPKVNDQGANVKFTKNYLGPRDSKLLVKYLLSSLPTRVRSIKGDAQQVNSKSSVSLDDFLEQDNGTLTKVILFDDKPKTMISYNALSTEFEIGRLLMGEVKKTEKKVIDAFGVTTFPTLVVLLPGKGDRSLVYDGRFNYKSLYKYLSTVTLTPMDDVRTLEVETTAKPLKPGTLSDISIGSEREQQDDGELDASTIARDEL